MNQPAQALIAARTRRSQRYFNSLTLFFYDFILYGIVSRFAWGSSTQRLDAHYRTYASANHLEVGVGTGYLLNRVVFASNRPRVALMDLSVACLERARRKVARHAPAIYIQNLLEPVRAAIPAFDSISVNYVMHCIPGGFKEKGVALAHLAPLLSAQGVLSGTTVLSEGVAKNLLARPAMWLLNLLGVFNNRRDSAQDLKIFPAQNFQVLEFEVVGVTAYFAVRKLPIPGL
jgi:hypothetical protein